jgi:pyridoxal biosynthesis lyase PdxS
LKRLPVVNFAAGGIATPGNDDPFNFLHRWAIDQIQTADAALMMQLGCDGGP